MSAIVPTRIKRPLRRCLGAASCAWAAAGALLLPCAGEDALAPVADKIVELPPLEVVASGKAAPWYYAAVPGLEVLSHCGLSETKEFVRAHARLRAELERVLPADLQVHYSAPDLVVLHDARTTPLATRDVVLRSDAARAANDTNQIRFLPNLCLWDSDISAVFAMLDPKTWDPGKLMFTTAQIQQWLLRRKPELPAWFVEGFVGLFPYLHFAVERQSASGGFRAMLLNAGVPEGGIGIRPILWRSVSETEKVRTDSDQWRTLLPLQVLLEAPPPDPVQDAAAGELWRHQAVLFIRWALDGTDEQRRQALWNYVRRAAQQTPNETLFRECFGRSYADVRDLLSDYLRSAVTESIIWPPLARSAVPAVTARLATPAEIGRINGTWATLAMLDVKRRHPEYLPRYLDQARQTLATAFARDPKDPQLLAQIGLLERELGEDDLASLYLDAAIKAPLPRPRPYAQLAQIRWARAATGLTLPTSRLSRSEADFVLQPLAQAWALAPALVENYLLAAEVWSHGQEPPTPEDWARISEGLQRFPRHALLRYFAAKLHRAHGSPATAEALLREARALTPDGGSEHRGRPPVPSDARR